jgi:hypothetical protein
MLTFEEVREKYGIPEAVNHIPVWDRALKDKERDKGVIYERDNMELRVFRLGWIMGRIYKIEHKGETIYKREE